MGEPCFPQDPFTSLRPVPDERGSSRSRRRDRALRGLRQRRAPGARVDYTAFAGALSFSKPLAREGRLGLLRWASMFFGVAGTYRKNDSVDVVYEAGGRRVVASGLPIIPPGGPEQPLSS